MSKVVSHRFVQKLRRKTKARIVLDFGDALWLPAARVQHFEEVLRLVDAVTTDNDATAKFVLPFNAQCTVIHDCPQVEDFDRLRHLRKRPSDRVTLGWVGTPSTLYNLYAVWDALEKLFAKHEKLHLRLLGTGWDPRLLPPFERVKYSCVPQYNQRQMIEEVLAMDIGLFPLQDVLASEVRGVLKATVYMSGEAVVVASAVGQAVPLIQEGVNGYLARSTSEWESKLDALIYDPALRERVARAGLETVRRDFTVEKAFGKLLSVLDRGA
jgi:glycosyltransferase involved in cell wall biosynthesis